jgi:hypothetical protein
MCAQNLQSNLTCEGLSHTAASSVKRGLPVVEMRALLQSAMSLLNLTSLQVIRLAGRICSKQGGCTSKE